MQTQLWDVPWSEGDFVTQMVKFGHPATLQSGLPSVLKEGIVRYNSMSAQQRMSYRASQLGFWLRRLVDLQHDEKVLKSEMDSEVVKVKGQKNILLWICFVQWHTLT